MWAHYLLVAGFSSQMIAGFVMFIGAPRVAGLLLLTSASALLYAQLYGCGLHPVPKTPS
jgi:hypothetical protein